MQNIKLSWKSSCEGVHLCHFPPADLRKFRTYKGNSVRDLLRAMRNKVPLCFPPLPRCVPALEQWLLVGQKARRPTGGGTRSCAKDMPMQTCSQPTASFPWWFCAMRHGWPLTSFLPTETPLPRTAQQRPGNPGGRPARVCPVLHIPLPLPLAAHVPGHAHLCHGEAVASILPPSVMMGPCRDMQAANGRKLISLEDGRTGCGAQAALLRRGDFLHW